MSEAKFTKGEWRIEGFVNDKGFEVTYNDDGEVIADYVYEESDAHLIAAAPEMYEMLSDFLSMDSLDVKLLLENSSCVSDLLAKARGEK